MGRARIGRRLGPAALAVYTSGVRALVWKLLLLAPVWTLLLILLALGCQPGTPVPPAAHEEPAPSAEPSSAPAAAVSAPPSARSAEPPPAPFRSSERFDLLIAGGRVIDGTGSPARAADVLVHDGRIVHVGAVAPEVAVDRRVDASGLVVAPGFIDTHAHGDARDPNSNFLAMGVTTLCLGQDGRSPTTQSLSAWIRGLENVQLATHALPFVGHGSVRTLEKVGYRKPTSAQLEGMARRVERALEAGAWGLTTGLEYQPGSFADADELAAVARPVGKVGGIVMSHLRSEDDDAIDAALDELIAQGKSAGARVHVAHIKVVYGKGAERAERLLQKMAAARAGGVAITADIYPYRASYTGIGIVFPDFAKPPHSFARAKGERRSELAAFLRERVTRRGGPGATLFGTPPELRGKTLEELARERNKPFEDVLIDDIGPQGAGAAYFVMDDALQTRLLVDPHVMIATDGSSGSHHPRAYGAFAKVIRRHVIEDEHLSLEQAIHKMTGLPAQTLGLTRQRRGLVRAGWAADLVAFDPARVRDRATYEHPRRLAEGMRWVWVAGVPAIADGKLTGRRGGRLLLRTDR